MALAKRGATSTTQRLTNNNPNNTVGKSTTKTTASEKKNNTTSVGKSTTQNTSSTQVNNRPTTTGVGKSTTQTTSSAGVNTRPDTGVAKADSSVYQAVMNNGGYTQPVEEINKSVTPTNMDQNSRPQTTYDVISPSTASNLISPSVAGNASGLLGNNLNGLSNSDLAAYDYDGTLGINQTPTAASQTFEQMTALPNETPQQRTDRYNGLLATLLGGAIGSVFDNEGKGTGYAGGRRVVNNNLNKQDTGALNDLYETLDSTASIGDRPYSTPNNTASILGDVYNIDNDITSKGGNGGGGTSSRGGGLGAGPAGTGDLGLGNGYDLDALYDLLNAQLAEYNNQYDSLMANLLAAYDQNNSSLDNYYNQVLALLGNNYADTESYLNGQLGNSQQALEDDRRRALQEAYIARMMQEKQLRDQLDAYGLTGGASESVMADLRNNYMNNRASVEEKTQSLLKDLLQNYIGNISNARQSYNQALMNAAQNQMNARQNYANNLAEAQTNAASYLANARSGAYENLYNTLAKLALQ